MGFAVPKQRLHQGRFQGGSSLVISDGRDLPKGIHRRVKERLEGRN